MSHDTEEQPIKDESEFVQAWLDAIESATKDEKDWRDDAEKAVKAYRGQSASSKAFNLYHANIETIVPALYNSVPAPDVRRRFLDPNPAAKAVSDIIERGLSYSIDAYDFDAAMNSTVRDMAICGRGIERVRYKAEVGEDDTVVLEETVCEYVPWRSFRHGPGRVWSDVTWIAFEHFLDKATIEARVDPEMLKEIPFDYSANAKDGEDNKESNKEPPRFGRRARVWEIWDKENREVHFISADYTERRLWTVPDPLELTEFFPIPRPMMAITTTDSLVPVTSYSLYESMLIELDEVSKRIRKLVSQLRPRGGYAASGGDDFKLITEAADGELVPLQGAEMFIQSGGGGIDKAITWFPLEPTVMALRELIQHREQIKQNIYEVTKIADVMRGVSKANETLGAQNLKAEWGSLAIQRMQNEVARFARDLFRLKAEILAGKMDYGHLLMVTGIKLPTEQEKQQAIQQYEAAQAQALQQPPAEGAPPAQAAPPPAPEPSPEEIAYFTGPSREEVEQLLKSDATRGYHIDIESDSTVKADLGRRQEHMSQWLQGVQHYGAAVGPMLQAGHMPIEVAVEGFAAISRSAKLGKQFEDSLDQWADRAKNKSGQPQADPNAAQAQAEQAKAQADAETKKMEIEAKFGFEREKLQAELPLKEREVAIKEAAHNRQLIEGGDLAMRQEEEMRDRMTMEAMLQASQQMMQGLATMAQGQQQTIAMLGQQTEAIAALARAATAPKRIVRGEDGRAIGVEQVMN